MTMEIIRTVKVKLDMPNPRRDDLHQAADQFRYCANQTSEWAWRTSASEYCVTSKAKAEEASRTASGKKPTSRQTSSRKGFAVLSRRSKAESKRGREATEPANRTSMHGVSSTTSEVPPSIATTSPSQR